MTPPARGPTGAARRSIREIGLGLITLGVVILAFVAYQLFGTALTEEHNQRALARDFTGALAHAHASARSAGSTGSTSAGELSPSTPTGVAIAHLVIPSIGVNKFVVQGTDEADLMKGPGHYVGTPMPGERGNVAIAGHRTTYGAPFYQLGELKPGALIYLTTTSGRTFDYRVAAKRVVPPSDVSVLDPTRDAQLTLTTCNPPYSATSRLVAVAKLVGRPVPTPVAAPAPAAAHQAKNLGSGTHQAWPPAIAYGAAAVVLWVLTRIALARTRRWRRLGVFVAGVALCAVPLWFCFENVVRLLPQSI